MQLSTFKTYIKYDFKRTDKDTELVQALNDAIRWLAAQMPHGGYKYQSWINTVNEQEDYPLPSTLMHLIHPIRLLEGAAATDSGYPLEHITKEKYDIEEPNPNRTSPSTGKPTKYTVFSRSLLLKPIPNSNTRIIEINWGKDTTDLSGDTDTPNLGAEYNEILKWLSLERLYDGMGMHEDAIFWGAKVHDEEGDPIGILKKLLDRERDIEGQTIGQVQSNPL